jgi:hypothetical protein
VTLILTAIVLRVVVLAHMSVATFEARGGCDCEQRAERTYLERRRRAEQQLRNLTAMNETARQSAVATAIARSEDSTSKERP